MSKPRLLLSLTLVSTLACAPGCREETPTEAVPSAVPEPLKPLAVRDTPLKVADEVAPFKAIAHTGQSFDIERFSNKPTLVHFCSSARQAQCLAWMRALREAWFEQIQVLSMALVFAADDGVWLRQVASEEKLPFLLVSDTDQRVASAFGVGKSQRLPHTFLLGKDRKVVAVVGPAGGASPEAILRAVPR